MNENDLRNLESKNNVEDWKSWPPEVFLAVLLHELRNPIEVISGWVGILADENANANHSKAIETISKKIAIIEEIHKELGEYINEHLPNPGS